MAYGQIMRIECDEYIALYSIKLDRDYKGRVKTVKVEMPYDPFDDVFREGDIVRVYTRNGVPCLELCEVEV